MYTTNVNINDLRWLMGAVRNEEIVQQYVLAGVLNNHLRNVPMSINHRVQGGVKYTYPILRFDVYGDVRKPSMGREYTHYMVAPVIDQPDLKEEHIGIHSRDANVLTVVLNVGYTEPPKPEEPAAEGSEPRRQNFTQGRGADLDWGVSWIDVARFQVEVMRLWAQAFPGQTYRSVRLQEGETVVSGRDLQCERWPEVPMYRVVTQVQPFINDLRTGSGESGLVDTIIQPLGQSFGGSVQYAHSGNLMTLNQYEQRLIEPSPAMLYGNRSEYEPSNFIVEEVFKKIPEALRGRQF